MSYTAIHTLNYNNQKVLRMWNTADYDTYRIHTVELFSHDAEIKIGEMVYAEVLIPKKGCIASHLQSIGMDVYACSTEAFEALDESRGDTIIWLDSFVRVNHDESYKGVMTLELDSLMTRYDHDTWMFPQEYGMDHVPAGLARYYDELGFLNRGELWCLRK